MVAFGYTVMGEQAGPKQLVADAQRAEAAGHQGQFFPWAEKELLPELRKLS